MYPYQALIIGYRDNTDGQQLSSCSAYFILSFYPSSFFCVLLHISSLSSSPFHVPFLPFVIFLLFPSTSSSHPPLHSPSTFSSVFILPHLLPLRSSSTSSYPFHSLISPSLLISTYALFFVHAVSIFIFLS